MSHPPAYIVAVLYGGLDENKGDSLLQIKRVVNIKFAECSQNCAKNFLNCCTDIKKSLNLHRIQVLPAREPVTR